MNAKRFLRELAERVEDLSYKNRRKFYLMAESNLNDVRVIRPGKSGGYGIDAQWCDDFQHPLHTLLTGERTGYYTDFGGVEDLVKALLEGFVYSWQYFPYRKRHHGSSSKEIPADRFIVFSQNHDQVGNRMLGERLAKPVSFEALKLAAGALLLSPYIPLIFMGEEYGEESPFLYVVSHFPDLIAAVREGRRMEFQDFKWGGAPPDPRSRETFLKFRLRWEKRREGRHKILFELYRRLIQLRRKIPALSNFNKNILDISGMEKIILLRRWHGESQVYCAMNFQYEDIVFHAHLPNGRWKKILDSSDEIWSGSGSSLPGMIAGGRS